MAPIAGKGRRGAGANKSIICINSYIFTTARLDVGSGVAETLLRAFERKKKARVFCFEVIRIALSNNHGYAVHSVRRLHRRDGISVVLVLAVLNKVDNIKDIFFKKLSKVYGLFGITVRLPIILSRSKRAREASKSRRSPPPIAFASPDRRGAIRTLTYWTKPNSGSCHFTLVFC
ncbi:hypothetical protein EVAR_66864_1 [Eumeta japonica]|uniref:Uncharacterized protein n=1 Tax=Eumeta variegata TaxID=151549 RepID=A0A4C1ZPE0_EUMVA|nr:hypothetical protein EVAR_66864_1 [Eumeta japonica]